MSAALRQRVYSLIGMDSELHGLGYSIEAETLYPNMGPDSPAADQQRFMVLRWGNTARGIGGANRPLLTVWAYNREPDYAPILQALARVRVLLPTLVGEVLLPPGAGAILGVDWQGDTDDNYDDAYTAYMRSSDHLITASGA